MCDECRYPGELAQQEPGEDAEAYEEHCLTVHDGRSCDCPVLTEEEIARQWAEQDRRHREQAHGGAECDCDNEPPF